MHGAVGQFKQLVELSSTDPSFNERLKQYLIPNKAREHVAQAVENDKRLRMWYPEPDNIEGGLLYRSVRARVDLEHPDGRPPPSTHVYNDGNLIHPWW